MLADATNAITETNTWDWLSSFTPHPNEGWMFTSHPALFAIAGAMKIVHTTKTFVWTMTRMEEIAKSKRLQTK
jgi:hypothetical protein